MKCPFCATENTTVVDTRIGDDGDTIRRRRKCLSCNKRFTTYEKVELTLPHIVKRNASRVPFERDKLKASMSMALRKRPVSIDTLTSSLLRIEENLLQNGESEVSSLYVGELVMRELRKLDKIAYIRFASVYRNFEDLDAFSQVIEELEN